LLTEFDLTQTHIRTDRQTDAAEYIIRSRLPISVKSQKW